MKKTKNKNKVYGEKQISKVRKKTKEKPKITYGMIVTVIVIVLGLCLVFFFTKEVVLSFLKRDEGNLKAVSRSQSSVDVAYVGAETEMYYIDQSDDVEQVFSSLKEYDSYVRAYRIIYTYESSFSLERVVLTKNDSRFKIDSSSKLVISDGEKLYIKMGSHEIVRDIQSTSFGDESGTTSLEKLKSLYADGKLEICFSDDEKSILAQYDDEKNGFLYEYEISPESGIILTEKSYYRGTLYRTVSTDYVNIFGADKLSHDFFNINPEKTEK